MTIQDIKQIAKTDIPVNKRFVASGMEFNDVMSV
jgi:hypothetical protein